MNLVVGRSRWSLPFARVPRGQVGGEHDQACFVATKGLEVLELPPFHKADAVDRDPPFAIARDVEGHRGRRVLWHRRRLGRMQHSPSNLYPQLPHGRVRLVTNLDLERASTGWDGWLDQRARSGQDGQHDAEGDGPQHDAIVACPMRGPVGIETWPWSVVEAPADKRRRRVTPADPRPTRRCLACNRELPANSRPERKFCSSACRYRHWNAANRGPGWYEDQEPRAAPPLAPRPVQSLLAGYARAGYWRGPDGCPPECPGIEPPYTWSEAIPEGREGLPPRRDVSSSLVERD